MESIPNLKPSDIEPFMIVLETVRESGLLERFDVDVHARFAEIEEQVRVVASGYYETKIQQLQSAPGVNRALPLLFMTDDLEKSAKLLSKRFPDPLFGYFAISFFASIRLMYVVANLTSFRWWSTSRSHYSSVTF